ncbi:helix-turn-helix transcriptional regulator [Tepidibacillus fermentans]|uniref:helix-turn-helix transcriptional regulator n=1 Tax=Tepidibacillus fermentans TaxID=1281767 RepID=UPI0010527F14|nr:helix-turn-helix transcriptional regulator [Tepidibacillus fermentans]
MTIELTNRQELILKIVQEEGPITGEQIAEKLNLTRATLRPDLSILTMAGYLEARPRVGYYYSGKKGNQLLKEMLNKMTVKDYKAVPVVIKEDTSVYDAIVTMFLEDVGTLYVVKERGTLAGIVSRKDLLKAAIGKQSLQDLPISVIMTRMPNIITCQIDDLLIEAANKLIQYQIDSIPVVKPLDNGEGLEVIGRITKTTIAKAFVELGKEKEV